MGVRADLSRAPSNTWGVRPCPPRLTKMPDNPEIWKAAAMADQFDKMQKLPDPLPGAPNFHRIPGYKVYMCGQPTLEGIKNVLEKVTGTIYPAWWQNCHPRQPAEAPQDLCCLHGGALRAEGTDRLWQGSLQWERDIPAAALANLEKLASGDFKENLGK